LIPTPRFESRVDGDGALRTQLFAGDRACDLGEVLPAVAGVAWDPRRETPLDALLQSGRFLAVLPDLVSRARDRVPPPPEGRLVAPLVRPGKILALGRTYREHALELGNAPLADPLVFDKLPDTLSGSGAVVAPPAGATGRLDHEGELALVVGQRAWALPNGNGRRAIAGVTVANDLTLRSIQKAAQKAGHPWLAAKNFPGSCALGPWLTALDPTIDLDRLEITCRVNGVVRQHASTASLVRPAAALVEWISQWFPLNPGDVILTGTPAGTGPLVTGDVCEVVIGDATHDLGTLVTRIG
jgi:2-keto-4-pentenoate hydratase/2-oxohepta-3-ene-1,7-dioic acid hydratase in catechol pathway